MAVWQSLAAQEHRDMAGFAFKLVPNATKAFRSQWKGWLGCHISLSRDCFGSCLTTVSHSCPSSLVPNTGLCESPTKCRVEWSNYM